MTKYSINRFFFPPEDMIKGQLLSKGQEKKRREQDIYIHLKIQRL